MVTGTDSTRSPLFYNVETFHVLLFIIFLIGHRCVHKATMPKRITSKYWPEAGGALVRVDHTENLVFDPRG